MSTLTWAVVTSTPFSLHDPTNGLVLVDYDGSGRRKRLSLAEPNDWLNGDQVNSAPIASRNCKLTLRIHGNSISQWNTRKNAVIAELNKNNLSISIACNGVTLENWYGCFMEEFQAVGMGSDSKQGHSKFGFMAAVPKQDYEFRFLATVPV